MIFDNCVRFSDLFSRLNSLPSPTRTSTDQIKGFLVGRGGVLPGLDKGTVLPYRVPQAKRAVLPYRIPQAKVLSQKYRDFLIPQLFSQVIPQYRYFQKRIPNSVTDTVKNPKYRGLCGIPRFSNTAKLFIRSLKLIRHH